MIRNHRMIQLQKAARMVGFGTYGNYKYQQERMADMYIWLKVKER